MDEASLFLEALQKPSDGQMLIFAQKSNPSYVVKPVTSVGFGAPSRLRTVLTEKACLVRARESSHFLVAHRLDDFNFKFKG